MKSLFFALLIFCFATPVWPQDRVVSSQFLDDATRAFIELRYERELTKALQAEIEVRKRKEAAQSELIESLNAEIEALRQQNLALSKIKCDKTQFFWGIITKKRCR